MKRHIESGEVCVSHLGPCEKALDYLASIGDTTGLTSRHADRYRYAYFAATNRVALVAAFARRAGGGA